MTQIDEKQFPEDPELGDLPLDDVDLEGDEDEDEKDEAGSNDPDEQ
ncbi:MAG: hypothetical protein M3R30_09430 [Candidatus Eremiobacteraeota bacterium]|nr:hypothetical protein [Candidatus Eremiobacteraeota bacterium]